MAENTSVEAIEREKTRSKKFRDQSAAIIGIPKTKGRDALYKVTLDPADVSPNVIKRFRTFKGFVIQLQGKFGKPISDITDDEIRAYAVIHAKRQHEKDKLLPGHGKQMGADAERLYRQYAKIYNAQTPNDHASLRQLAAIEVALLKLSEKRLEALEKNEMASVLKIIDSEKVLSSEHRQLQEMLGIDKGSRDQEESRKGGADYMRNLMRQAKDLFASMAVRITCAKCNALEIDLHMGHVLCHFDGWIFQVPCPKCGQLIVLKASDAQRL